MSIPESHLAQEAIAALVDGELSGGAANRAARHLTGCLQCRMAVAAQREAKEALHRSADVAVPGDLLSRLRAIPFTADVPSGSAFGNLSAGGGQLTGTDGRGSWTVPLAPVASAPQRPGQARWLRRGLAGALVGLGAGV
ncbi:MAG TPA: zf-HC2 domain-containing protein, partial [Blastococcus sp.]